MSMQASSLGFRVASDRSSHYGEWVSVFRYAEIMERPVKTVYEWLYSGTLREFGTPVHRDERGKWWIQVVF